MKKRILPLIMAGAMMLSSFAGMTMSANAANVADTNFAFNNADTESRSEWRDKTNTTKVYVYPTSGLNILYTVEGRTTPGAQAYEWSEQVTIPVGIKGSITNMVKEYGGTQARLKMNRPNEVKPSLVYTRGVWSPDSTQNYTVFP